MSAQRPLPPQLATLHELALDLRWTWSSAADRLWSAIDADTWARTHNAWFLLQAVSSERLALRMSTGTLLPDGNSARFVYAAEPGRLFISGTHYHDWVDETNRTNDAFFEVVGAPSRP